MGEITYQTLQKQFSSGTFHSPAEAFPAVILVHGEEALCKEAVALMLEYLSPETENTFRCETIDATTVSIPDICEKVNTYSLLADGRTIVASNANVFGAGTGQSAGLKKSKQAFDQGNMALAAKRLLRVLGRMNCQVEDLAAENRAATIRLIDAADNAQQWMAAIFDYCIQTGLGIPEGGDSDAEFLYSAVQRGVPAGNRLILVSENVDKRSRLYRLLKKDGFVVDCSLPKGDRKADRDVKESFLRQRFTELVSGVGKRASGGVFEAIVDRTGFDVRTFTGGIEKLIDYIGERDAIEVDDVRLLLPRTKKDPLYEFTGSIAERNPEKALSSMQSLLAGDFEPLQLLAAVANQIRKLLVARAFLDGPGARLWQRGLPFKQFQSRVYPAIQNEDAAFLESVKLWKAEITSASEAIGVSPASGKAPGNPLKFQPDELLIAKAKRHPYPVYQDIRRAEQFSMAELVRIYQAVAESDIRLKSTGQNPVRVLEMLIFEICPAADEGAEAGSPAGRNP